MYGEFETCISEKGKILLSYFIAVSNSIIWHYSSACNSKGISFFNLPPRNVTYNNIIYKYGKFEAGILKKTFTSNLTKTLSSSFGTIIPSKEEALGLLLLL